MWVSSNLPSPGAIQSLCFPSPQGRRPEDAVESSEPQAVPFRAVVASFGWSSLLCLN